MNQKKKKYRKLPQGNVSLMKRFFAYVLDFYFGLLMCALPVVIGNGIINQDSRMQFNLFFFDGASLYVITILSLLFGYVYYVYVPCKVWKGQTLAKHMMHIKIVQTNGDEVTRRSLFLRHMIGMFLIEGAVMALSTVLRQFLTIATGINLVDGLMYLSWGLTIVSCIFMVLNRDRRMFHDVIGNTMVVTDTYQS